MVSILTVPEQNAGNKNKVEINPSQTRQWLAKLPMLDTELSLNNIYDSLHKLNRTPIRPGARLRLLELYRTPFAFIGASIEKNLSENYVPLPEKYGNLAQLCKQVAIEIAYGYKSVVLDSARAMRSTRPNDDLCTGIHRSIRYLTVSMYQSALYYNSCPPGTWNELHSLFVYARKLGIQNRPVRDALNKPKPKNSISHVYNQALLLGLSDNYRHPVGIIGKIHRYLDRWASVVDISTYAKPPTTRCQFVVDPEQDRSAQPYSEDMVLKKSRRLLLLDTRAITKTAHDQWHKLYAGASPKSAGLGDNFFDDNDFDMLERVVIAWGLAPTRKYPRNTISGPYQLALGLNASNFFLNGSRSFKCISDESQQYQQIATSGTFGLQQIKKHDENYVTQNWQASNESIHGLCLYVDLSKPAVIQVRVGDVIAFRMDRGDASWSAGLVRWVRITGSELRLGLQKLGAGAKAIALKPVKANNTVENFFKSSILLPRHETVQQAQSIIAPPGLFRQQRNLFIDDGEVLTTVQANKLLERSRYFDWFSFELLNC